MRYLAYKSQIYHGAGLSDKRACLSRLLVESKLTNRIAIIPKFILTGDHNSGVEITSYLLEEYFLIEKFGIEYIFDDVFREDLINCDDIMCIEEGDEIRNVPHTLLIRNFVIDSFYHISDRNIKENAKHIHAYGEINTIPLFDPTVDISNICKKILSELERPIIGIWMRRGDRLNSKLDDSMSSKVILKKLGRFNYKSIYYCSDDVDFAFGGNNIYTQRNFTQYTDEITDNYKLFSIDMFVIDSCDISVRTFSDSYVYFNKKSIGENYSIANYSMHGSHEMNSDIPNELVEQHYISNIIEL